MKRVLSWRNRMVFGAALMAMLLIASSFTFSPSFDAPLVGDRPQKKEQKVKVIVKKDGRETKIDTTFNLPDEEFDVMIQKGDSGMTKHIRKIIRVGGNADVISMGDMADSEFLAPPPPPPPPPPVPPFMMKEQSWGNPFEFDTNDASIISYDKKDIGKGLEKITIIRKKRPENRQ
ncbi:MAG: hypothetical protein GZ094_01975 [Mariniphaga sp.]|nr:hypothetical protein [Mariniphaga sp.]